MHLIELDSRRRRSIGERREPLSSRSEGCRDDDLPLRAGWTSRFGRGVAARQAEELPAVRRQLNRARPVDDATLAELVADRADDRDGKLSDAADLSDCNGLESSGGAYDVANACVALGQADARGNLVDDPGRFRHRRPRARIETLVRVAPRRSLTT